MTTNDQNHGGLVVTTMEELERVKRERAGMPVDPQPIPQPDGQVWGEDGDVTATFGAVTVHAFLSVTDAPAQAYLTWMPPADEPYEMECSALGIGPDEWEAHPLGGDADGTQWNRAITWARFLGFEPTDDDPQIQPNGLCVWPMLPVAAG